MSTSIPKKQQTAPKKDGDAVMPKPVKAPTEDDFKAWLDEAQAWVGDVGLEPADVDDAIGEVRSEARR